MKLTKGQMFPELDVNGDFQMQMDASNARPHPEEELLLLPELPLPEELLPELPDEELEELPEAGDLLEGAIRPPRRAKTPS